MQSTNPGHVKEQHRLAGGPTSHILPRSRCPICVNQPSNGCQIYTNQDLDFAAILARFFRDSSTIRNAITALAPAG